MTKIAQINVDGIDYAVSGASLTGICSSPASDYMKLVTLTDSNSIEDGVTIACTFVHENSAGTAPASLTLYSTDQIHFYTDAGMTEPYALAPSGCFELTYTGSGNAYSYISYPVVAIGTLSGIVSAPVCDSHGKVTSRSLWKAGDVVFLQYKSRKFFVVNDGSGNSTAGVAFKGTRSAYNTAKLIPEGSDGHIPSGALVIITDEGKTYVTEGTGSSQTLEPVANATFNGSHAQWNALTSAQKAMYNIVNFTDDEAVGLTVSDTVEDGNMNPVTSNAVAQLGTVDVSSGNTFRLLAGRLLAIWYDTNIIYLHIPFPFVTKNTDYSITLDRIHLDGVGDVQNVASVATKYNGGCDILINNNASGVRLATTVDITITF